MRRYQHLLASYVPMLAVIAVLIATPGWSSFAIGNLAVQAVLFTTIAAIPAHRTGKMSYVDIAWPWGLVAIGLQVTIYAPRFGPAVVAISAAYLAVGLRMGLPGLVYIVRFRSLGFEFHRYRYQRIRWTAAGWRDERVPMQLEIFLQCLANSSVLVVPALLMAADRDRGLTWLQLAALVMWAGCWSLEWLADRQKRQFAARSSRTAVCEAGLWRYSRHPNYFFQWMGWNALALAAAPSLVHLAHVGSAPRAGALALALLGGPAFMLWTLIDLTGITPSEHYSVRKRPGYVRYQRTTNSFVPGPRRTHGEGTLAQEAGA
jgi:steroid 5-alpha reductase family enzyme